MAFRSFLEKKTLEDFRANFPKYDECTLIHQMGVPVPGVQVLIKTFILLILGHKIPSYMKESIRSIEFVVSKTHSALGYIMSFVYCLVGFNDYYSNTRNKLVPNKELLKLLEHYKQQFLDVYKTRNCDHLIPFFDALIEDIKDSQPKTTILHYELSIKKATKKKVVSI